MQTVHSIQYPDTNLKVSRIRRRLSSIYEDACQSAFGRNFKDCSDYERYYVLATLIAGRARSVEIKKYNETKKKVYYFSLEFLLGPLMDNYLLNIGVRNLVDDALRDLGSSLDLLEAQ
jgi:starch phosphorylase